MTSWDLKVCVSVCVCVCVCGGGNYNLYSKPSACKQNWHSIWFWGVPVVWHKNIKKNNIVVGGIYRSPPSSPEYNMLLLIELLKEILLTKHDHIIKAGDFNLKQINSANRSVSGAPQSYQQKLFDTKNDLFLIDTVNEPSRFRDTVTPSCLDWVLTENPNCFDDKTIDAPIGLWPFVD